MAFVGTPTENKELVRKHLEEAVSQRRPELWQQLLADDFRLHHPLVDRGVYEASRPGHAAAVQGLWEAFPEVTIEIFHLVAEHDHVTAHYVERVVGQPATLTTPSTRSPA